MVQVPEPESESVYKSIPNPFTNYISLCKSISIISEKELSLRSQIVFTFNKFKNNFHKYNPSTFTFYKF